MAPTRGGRKVRGGGKSRTNKDHRQSGLKQRANKGRWDDICARQLQSDVISKVLAEKTQLDPDLPGLGQHYCVACRCALVPHLAGFGCNITRASAISHLFPLPPCSKYCISAVALEQHLKTSKHRRRLKTLTTEKIYDHKEANAAAGRGDADHGITLRENMTID
eukprot:scaffold142136_cov37-Tisochrysis_lutea.AAC.2